MMLLFSIVVFSLLSLVQVRPSASGFVFEFGLHSVSTMANVNCDRCETYLSIFCLREGRSTQSEIEDDCPLGSSGRTNVNDVFTLPLMRRILSQKPWTVSNSNSMNHAMCN